MQTKPTGQGSQPQTGEQKERREREAQAVLLKPADRIKPVYFRGIKL